MNKYKIKSVIFDLDGTLLNTIDDIADSANNVLKSFGFETHPVEKYRCFVGDGTLEFIKRILPLEHRQDNKIIQDYLEKYKKEYTKRWNNKTKPYEGINTLLSELTKKNVIINVNSNKSQDFVKIMVKAYFAKFDFKYILGASLKYPNKPNPESTCFIANSLGINSSEIMFVGDSDIDIKTAVAADMVPVGVLWGFRDENELISNGAKIVLSKPIDLLNYI